MPFNGSGIYTLPSGNPVVTGSSISSTTQNATMSDVATALSNCVTRDGQSPATANLPMGSNKITGLASGTGTGDAINYDQVQYIANVASAGTSGQVLTSSGTGAPIWTTPSLTNLTGGATGSLPYQSAANTTSMLSAGTNGQILTISGGVPSWQNSGTATNATNLAGGSASQIPYQSATNTTSFIANGTAGQVLTSNGTSPPSWQTPTVVSATNLSAGSAGAIPYQVAYGTTSYVSAGTSGQVLLSAGTSAPTWGYYPFSSISGKPTTMSGYGITDGVTTASLSSTLASYATTSYVASTYATISTVNGKANLSGGNTFSGVNYFGSALTSVSSAQIMAGQTNSDAIIGYAPSSGYSAIVHGVSSTSSALSVFLYGTPASWSNVGSITTSGAAVSYNTASDYRLKDVLSPILDATARVKAFRPIRFKWKNHIDLPAVDGFIAHEVAELVPEAVHGEKDAVNPDGSIKPQGLDQAKLVPVLIAALQDAFLRIEDLEAKVNAG